MISLVSQQTSATELESFIADTLAQLEQYHSSLGREVVKYPDRLTSQLAEFVLFLERWTKTIDLVSQESGKSMVIPHIADSVAGFILAAPSEEACCDVGSGAGLPGIVWAMLKPQMQIVLLEPRKRRVDFLREVRRVLSLSNVEIIDKRVEEIEHNSLWPTSVVSRLFVCRAFGMEQKYLEFAQSQKGKGSARALILAGPSWACPKQLLVSGLRPNGEEDYSILSDAPKRKLISWNL